MGPFGYRNDGSRSSGCGPRVLIALLIAIVGFFMYMTNTEVNPVTGAKQHVTLTPEQEVRLGIQSAPEMAAQMGGEVSASDPRTQEVQRIGKSIVEHSEASHSPWHFHYHLLADTKTVNAFALPGGQVFITLGLLNKLQTEAQLAGVLAHETGHVIERHSAQQLAKGQLGQMLVLATGVGASGDSSRQGYQAAMIASVVNQMAQLRYSRTDELQADQWGLKLMEKAGYTPKAMIEVMQILEKEGNRRGHSPEMLMSHPYPEKRIEAIKAYLEKNPPNPQLTEGRNLRDVLESHNSD
jgi:predicted Zn-dependent protease